MWVYFYVENNIYVIKMCSFVFVIVYEEKYYLLFIFIFLLSFVICIMNIVGYVKRVMLKEYSWLCY